jgi:hypothetical protein
VGNFLPEDVKILSTNVKEWLERETGSVFAPVHGKAQKLLNEMKEELDKIVDNCRTLLENSSKEIEKRNMKTYGRARALNKLARLFLKRMQEIEAPEEVSYDNYHDFVKETQKAFLVTEVDIKNWFPRISPFFIMDRRKFLGIFEKAKQALKELNSFLRKEYVKTKTLEETFQLIDRLPALERQLADFNAQKEKIISKKTSIERKITETRKKITNLENRESLSHLDQVNMEIEKLSQEVKHNLRHLRKPFIKFQSRVSRKGGLTPEQLEKLNHYIENPFNAFSTEQAGYLTLKRILEKLAGSISEGKLKLKRDRKRKAEHAIDIILNKNSFSTLHGKCMETITLKKQLSTSAETTRTKRSILKSQEELKKLERKRKLAESERKAVERNLKETMERIHRQKKEIEKNVLDFTDKRILVELKVQ